MLFDAGCGRLRIYQVERNVGSALSIVIVERSSTNYVTVSNIVLTTNYLVTTPYPGSNRLHADRVSGAAEAMTNATVGAMTKTNALPSAITESSESRVSRERWNGRALEWLMTLVVVLLLVVLMLLLREDEQRAGLIEAPRQSDGSLADKADSLLPLSDTPAKGAEIVSAPESFEAMTEIVRPLSPAAPKHPHWGSAVLRAGIIRRIAEMMMDKFVLRLISHRQQLLHIQNQASRQVAYLDARLASIQKRMEERIAVYEKHIAQLKQQLALKQAAERERTATRPTE